MTNEKLSWKEKYAALLILIMGILYALAQLVNHLSSKTSVATAENGKIVLNSGELMSNLYTYIYIVIALLTGILLLRGKTLGWILGLPFLLFFCIIAGSGVVTFIMLNVYDLSFIVVALLFFLLLLAFIFLVRPAGRRKYRVGKYTWLPTLVFLMALCSMFFFLQ